jgi:hypothetical protein
MDGCGIDRQRARRLRGTQPRCTFGDLSIKQDDLPSFERRTVASRNRLVARAQGTDEHFGYRDCRHRESQSPRCMSLKQGLKMGRELLMIL